MIRTARPTDFGFVRSITGQPEVAGFIEDAPDTELAAYLRDPRMDLVIWHAGQQPAGFALFCEIGNPSGRVELRRLGLRNIGPGQGADFLYALIDHGFDTLNAARIWLDVVADNPRAQHLYQQVGFQHEGTLRQNWRCPTGDVVDMQIYGLLRNERPA